MILLLGDFIAAYFLDLIFGDPNWLPHPIRFIGWIIKKYEKLLGVRKRSRFNGFLLLLFSVLSVTIPIFIFLLILKNISPLAFHVANVYLLYTSFATKCLIDEGKKIYKSLKNETIEESRIKIGMLVGRETGSLNKEQITKATIETIAENSVDGILSPMLYALLGIFLGMPAVFAYIFKTVSTLDSMVGYKNDKYKDLGFFSAKFDDLLNLIPARLSILLIPFAAFFTGNNPFRSFKIAIRDRKNHLSPNCPYPEGAYAGALGIRLGGTHIYFGEKIEKPTIGDDINKIHENQIKKAINITWVFSILSFLIFIAIGALLIK